MSWIKNRQILRERFFKLIGQTKSTIETKPIFTAEDKCIMPIDLGYTYKDKITGFTGVATGYVKYISGCNQVLLIPTVGEDGSYKEGQWFDEQRLTLVGDKNKIVLNNSVSPGFDTTAPKK